MDAMTAPCPECGGDGGWDDYRPGVPWLDCPFCDGSGSIDTESADDIDDFEVQP